MNLFDPFLTNAELLQSFIKRIEEHSYNVLLDFPDFFIGQLNNAINICSEREMIPEWVLDTNEYKIKYEILIMLNLFEGFLKQEKNFDIDDLVNIDLMNEKQFGKVTENMKVPKIVNDVINKIKEFGKERNWDLDICEKQILKILGMKFGFSILNFLLPKENHGIDYN